MATISQIQTALDDNASWFTEQSVTKCKLWIDACTQLLIRPEESQQGGQGTSARWRSNFEILQQQLITYKHWLEVNDTDRGTGERVIGVDFSDTDLSLGPVSMIQV